MRLYLTFLLVSLCSAWCMAQSNTFPATGNVGIGTGSPGYNLEILGNIMVKGTYYVNSADGNSAGLITTTNDAGSTNGIMINANRGSGYIVFHTNNGIREKMRIQNNGNVGIGTTVPTHKLEVNGTVRAKEIKLEAAVWPDYVFAPGYRLRSLSDNKLFIEENGHLPGLEPAGYYEREGVELMKLNLQLVEKIEELMLHAIRQEEKLNELKEEVSRLKKPNSEGLK